MYTCSMNKVKIQTSANACPSAKGAAICTLEGLFSMWEARERKKEYLTNLLANTVKRAGWLLFQQAEVVGTEWAWQREALAFQPFTINSSFGGLRGAKWEHGFLRTF